MLTVLLVIQVMIAVSMITIILFQRSASDGLGGLGGGGGGNSLVSGRATANILTKTTAILATAFMVNSLAMATITARSSDVTDSIMADEGANIETVTEKKRAEPAVPIAE